jgi:hypothetical protein
LVFRSTKRKIESKAIMRVEDKFNIGPNRKNISQLILSEAVEAFVGTFGCVLGGSLQHIWS